MHRNRKKRNIVIFSLVGVLFLMVAGYAAFSTNLEIKGTSKVTSNWDIEITDVKETAQNGLAENVKMYYEKLEASVEANLYDKGDSMEYDITIENKGTLDAKLNDILTNTENSNSEAVLITFSGYTKGEVLKSQTSKVIHVKIEYNPEYKGEPTSGEVDLKFDYVQDNKDPENPQSYLLTYDYSTNGGTRADTNEEFVYEGDNVSLGNIAYKEGWTFVGWNTNKNAENGLTSYEMPAGQATLYAIFKKDLKVTYEKGENVTNIGKTNESCSIYNNETSCEITLPEITVSSGYLVDGWYSENTNVGKPNSKYNISNDINLIAKAIEDTIDLDVSTTSTTNSITVVANATSPSGIKSYEYSINDGQSYTKSTEKTHEFKGLTNESVLEGAEFLENKLSTNSSELYKDEYGNIRYYGKNPNNYVSFNNETWRIIGVVDGKIKLIRNAILTPVTTDKGVTIGTSSGFYWNKVQQTGKNYNNWEGSTLQNYLNGTYYNSIGNTYQNMIEESTFYLGGATGDNYRTLTSSGYYQAERDSTQVYSGNPGSTKQKIGLMYPSDYGYAAGESCQSTALNKYSSSCKNTDYLWLNNGKHEWLQVPNASYNAIAANLYSDGSVFGSGDSVFSIARAVRPVLYLKSQIRITGGDGSINNKFTLGTSGGFKGTSYPVKVRVTSNTDKELTSETINTPLKSLPAPTFTESGVKPKTVTITYPKECSQSNFTCTYQKDNGSSVRVTSSTKEVSFDYSGTLVATVSDGTNTMSSSYTVTVKLKAEHLSYENNKTNLPCEDAQCALDELRKMLK